MTQYHVGQELRIPYFSAPLAEGKQWSPGQVVPIFEAETGQQLAKVFVLSSTPYEFIGVVFNVTAAEEPTPQ